MKSVNKTAEILKFINKNKLVEHSDFATQTLLLDLYSNSKTTSPLRRIIDTCNLLAKRGYLSVGEVDGEKIYKITQKGEVHLQDSILNQADLIKKNWNGRWYLVCFQISEAKKLARNQLLLLLKRHGFKRYSKSVWILPYNPSLLVNNIKLQLDLEKEIKLVVASRIDQETQLKRQFEIN